MKNGSFASSSAGVALSQDSQVIPSSIRHSDVSERADDQCWEKIGSKSSVWMSLYDMALSVAGEPEPSQPTNNVPGPPADVSEYSLFAPCHEQQMRNTNIPGASEPSPVDSADRLVWSDNPSSWSVVGSRHDEQLCDTSQTGQSQPPPVTPRGDVTELCCCDQCQDYSEDYLLDNQAHGAPIGRQQEDSQMLHAERNDGECAGHSMASNVALSQATESDVPIAADEVEPIGQPDATLAEVSHSAPVKVQRGWEMWDADKYSWLKVDDKLAAEMDRMLASGTMQFQVHGKKGKGHYDIDLDRMCKTSANGLTKGQQFQLRQVRRTIIWDENGWTMSADRWQEMYRWDELQFQVLLDTPGKFGHTGWNNMNDVMNTNIIKHVWSSEANRTGQMTTSHWYKNPWGKLKRTMYTVDFDTMTQMNPDSHMSRPIRFVVEESVRTGTPALTASEWLMANAPK